MLSQAASDQDLYFSTPWELNSGVPAAGLSRNASEDAADAGDSSAQWGRKADTGTEIGYGRTHGNYGELGAQPAESNQQGIVGKLASAVGLGGESAPGTGQGQGGAGGSYTDDWSRKANTSGELHEPYLRGDAASCVCSSLHHTCVPEVVSHVLKLWTFPRNNLKAARVCETMFEAANCLSCDIHTSEKIYPTLVHV